MAISPDEALIQRLQALLARENVAVIPASLEEATTGRFAAGSTTWLVDLRRDDRMLAGMMTIRRAHPACSLIAVADDRVGLAEAYASGATAVTDADVAAIAACHASLARHQGGGEELELFSEGLSLGLHKLRRLVQDTRARGFTSSVSQDVLSLLSESVERAVFFLVEQDTLRAAGAFGAVPAGPYLAERAHGLTLGLDEAGVLGDCARGARARAMCWRDAGLPKRLAERIGRPAAGFCAVFPVRGVDEVVAVVYADNGQREWPIEEMEFLGLAVEHIGLAVENELLRRRVEGEGSRNASD